MFLLSYSLISHVSFAQARQEGNVQTQPTPNVLFTDAEDYFSSSAPVAHKHPSAFFLPADVWHDQESIWTSPRHIQKQDLLWLFPLAATTGILIATDHHEMTLIHSDATNRDRSSQFSNAGLGVFAGAAGLSYALGAITHNEHAREAGLLSTEAMVDAVGVAEAMKFLSYRSRPDTGSASGLFGHASPLDSSFPSNHAALAWSAAAVFAREYPGPVAQWAAYGLASVVSLSRITAEQHFPSDVLIGAATGYLIGRFVYGAHHNDAMSDRTGSTPLSNHKKKTATPTQTDAPRRPRTEQGSPYVPLDSWIYPALKRLAALGYVSDQVSDLAPWTRAECLHQTQQAADEASTREAVRKWPALNEEALQLIAGLNAELGREESGSNSIRLESLYTEVTGISGTPLRDSYHFGQSLVDNFGRPYDRGFNNVTGLSGHATAGPFFAYFRGEYQNAPGRAADSLAVRQFIATADDNPLQGPQPIAATNRFEPLEMYAGVKLGFENITFGKQDLWWGPGEYSAFSFSDNAEPFYMLRFAQARPIILPGVFAHLGKIRTEVIFGKLSGHLWPPRPYVNAQKISLDLTNNFEVAFTRSAFFGGVGHPLTLGSVESSLFSTTSLASQGGENDPGDRHSGFDFRYRVPGLRRYVTIYSDSYADDDPSPLDNPKRAAWGPGLYLTQIPGLRRLDFRFESYSTLLYRKDQGGGFIYWNGEYHDAYTNNGMLLGSWVGRDSRAYVASTTYWFSAKSKIQGQYKQIKAGTQFLPGGGTQTDASLSAQWSLTPEWMIGGSAQYERYYVPILGGAQRDLVGSFQMVFTPRRWGR